MSRLIHIIYSSAAHVDFTQEQLLDLLARSRSKNTSLGITGMLLHIEGSFLQVIEGRDCDIDSLFAKISADPRHGNIITIIRESIPKRSFSDWSMGFADVTRADFENAEGFNDFLSDPSAVQSLVVGRAQKLLKAFKDGRWRSQASRPAQTEAIVGKETDSAASLQGTAVAFQPIVCISQHAISSYEALAWDTRTQREIMAGDLTPEVLTSVEKSARELAMQISAGSAEPADININVRPTSPEDAIAKMQWIIDQANAQNIDARKITLELNQDCLNGDLNSIITIVQDCKENGLHICLDNFGAGRSGLNQMEMSQPNSIALNAKLVRDIDSNGAKQAIIRGLMQTCDDLGIDVIAKHVETQGEFEWLLGEGIDLFQGGLFCHPALGSLPTEIRIPR